MAGQLLIRNCEVRRAPVGKGWVIVHPGNHAVLGEYDDEYHAREVARALATLGYQRGGVRPWRVDTAIVDGKNVAIWEGRETVWARTVDAAREIAMRITEKRDIPARETAGFSEVVTSNAVELTGERPEVEAPRPIGVDVWVTHPEKGAPYLKRDRWRGIGEIVKEITARIDASDLSTEYHGGSGLMSGRVEDSPATLQEMHGFGDRLWRIVVGVVVGANEGYYVHVWSMGQASGAGRTAISLYTVKCLSGEAEAETIAACLRDWISEG